MGTFDVMREFTTSYKKKKGRIRRREKASGSVGSCRRVNEPAGGL